MKGPEEGWSGGAKLFPQSKHDSEERRLGEARLEGRCTRHASRWLRQARRLLAHQERLPTRLSHATAPRSSIAAARPVAGDATLLSAGAHHHHLRSSNLAGLTGSFTLHLAQHLRAGARCLQLPATLRHLQIGTGRQRYHECSSPHERIPEPSCDRSQSACADLPSNLTPCEPGSSPGHVETRCSATVASTAVWRRGRLWIGSDGVVH